MINKTNRKILYIADYYKPAFCYGGGTTSVVNLCEGMVQQGAHVDVFATDANCKQRLDIHPNELVNVDGVNVRYFNRTTSLFNYFYSIGLSKAIVEMIKNYDVVMAGALWSHGNYIAVNSCLKYKIPYIISLHGQLNPWAYDNKKWKKKLYMQFVVRRHLNNAAGLHCTDKIEEEYVRKFNFHSNIFIIPFGINTADYILSPEKGEFRRKYFIGNHCPVLLFVGRLSRIKRPDIAIKVLSAVRNEGLDAHLLIAGPDEDGMETELLELCEQLEVEQTVHFTGLLSQKDILKAYADSSLLLVPSEVQENFGMSSIEALAAGLPIVVSDGIPVGKWAENAKAGVVVRCDVREFSDNVINLLKNPDLLNEMGQNGRELAKNNFEIQIVSRNMLNQIDNIIKNRDNPNDEI